MTHPEVMSKYGGEFDRVKRLLSSNTSEEKLAGLVLVSSYLQHHSMDPSELEYVMEVS